MNRALIVAFYYPPMGGGGITRPLKFTKYLPSFGWQPAILTAKPHHYWFRDDRRIGDIPPGTEIRRTPAITGIHFLKRFWKKKDGKPSVHSRDAGAMNRFRKLASWFLIPDSFIGWLPFAVIAGLRMCRTFRPNVIFATSPPPTTLVTAYILSKLTGIPLITDYRDLWTEDMHFDPPTRFHRSVHRVIEKTILRHATQSVFINDRMMNMMDSAFPDMKTFSVIRSGYDPDDVKNITPAERNHGMPFRFVHTGNLTLNRPIGGLLQALRELIDEKQINVNEIEIYFYGQRDSHNDRLIEQYRPLPVFCRDSESHAESMQLQASADGLLFMGYDTNEKVQCVTTGKMYEYLYWSLRFGKPVLALTADCDAADLVRRTDTGTVIPMRDVPSIKTALLNIVKSFPQKPDAQIYDTEIFSIRRSTEKLADLFNLLTRSITE